MTAAFAMVFVRHGTAVCLTRRADQSPIAPGRWTAIPIELAPGESPAEALDRLEADPLRSTELAHVRTGGELTVETPGGQMALLPVLAEVVVPGFAPPDEQDVAWVDPSSILERDTPPWLWRAYESVGPTVRSVTADTSHGSTYLSLRALEALRDRAARLVADEVDGADELANLAGDLRSARSDMLALTVRVGKAVAEGTDPSVVLARTRSVIEAALTDDPKAARVAAHTVGDVETVFVFSRSGTVLDAIEHLAPDRVVTTVATPGDEGIAVAEGLADRYEVVLAPDAAVASVLDDGVDVVLLGADGVDATGRVTNKLGSYTVAAVAAQLEVPCYFVTTTAKLCDVVTSSLERAPPGSIYTGEASIDVRVDRFDRTPPSLISGYCTEAGVLSLDDVREVAERHARYR